MLFWGVLGALVMRGIFIFAGAALLHRFNWLMYVFGAFLIFTAFKLGLGGETEIKPERNVLIRLFRKIMPVTEHLEGESFFVRHAGVLMATPLFLVLLVVESTDLVFAVDSIPAVLAVTQNPFLVYTSNVFAILGLRALYFLLGGRDGQVPLSEAGAVAHPGLRGHQDADRRLLQDPHHALTGRHRRRADHFRRGIAGA